MLNDLLTVPDVRSYSASFGKTQRVKWAIANHRSIQFLLEARFFSILFKQHFIAKSLKIISVTLSFEAMQCFLPRDIQWSFEQAWKSLQSWDQPVSHPGSNQTNVIIKWAPASDTVSSSISSWQILTAHAQPFRGARDLAFCLKVPLDSMLVWASSGGSGETARMCRLAWTFAARIGDTKFAWRGPSNHRIWQNNYSHRNFQLLNLSYYLFLLACNSNFNVKILCKQLNVSTCPNIEINVWYCRCCIFCLLIFTIFRAVPHICWKEEVC